MRWATLILGAGGAFVCGHLGTIWLREAWRLRLEPELAAAMGIDITAALGSALALWLAMIVGLLGAVLAHQRQTRVAGVLLLAAGLGPGLLDARAFVVGSVLCLAGILALGMEPGDRPAAEARRSRSLLERPDATDPLDPLPMMSRVSHVSVG